MSSAAQRPVPGRADADACGYAKAFLHLWPMLPSDVELHAFLRWCHRQRRHGSASQIATLYAQAAGVGLGYARDLVARAVVDGFLPVTGSDGQPREVIPDKIVKPHRHHASGCSRCGVRWPCRSVATGIDSEPAPARFADWPEIGTAGNARAELASKGLIRDTGRRRGARQRIVWTLLPGVDPDVVADGDTVGRARVRRS